MQLLDQLADQKDSEGLIVAENWQQFEKLLASDHIDVLGEAFNKLTVEILLALFEFDTALQQLLHVD